MKDSIPPKTVYAVEDVERTKQEVFAMKILNCFLFQLLSFYLTQKLSMEQASPIASPSSDIAAEKALLWKQDKRIVPLSAAIYFLCYLDRSNIGNAKILNSSSHNDLLSETHMTSYQYTIALMIFLVAYGIFEAPSNGISASLPGKSYRTPFPR